MPRDYETADAPTPANNINDVMRKKAAYYAGQENAKVAQPLSYSGESAGVSYGTAAMRMTSDMLIQEKIAALHQEINALKALRAALPREMGFEADNALFRLLAK